MRRPLLLTALLVSLLALYGLLMGSEQWLLVAMGCSAPIALLLPTALSRDSLFVYEPIVPLALTLLFSTVGRSIYVAFWSDDQARFLLFWQTHEEVVANGWWVPLGLLLYGIGYASTRKRLGFGHATPVIGRHFAGARRFAIVSLIAAALGVLSFLLYSHNLGLGAGNFSDAGMERVSVKRPGEIQTDSGDTVYHSHGPVRLLGSVGEFVLYTLLVFLILRRRTQYTLWVPLIALLVLSNALIPFFTSSRSGIVFLFVNSALILLFYRRLRFSHIAVVLTLALAIFVAMGQLRHEGQMGERKELDVMGMFFGFGNWIDIPRTSAILDRMPERHPYLLGATYAAVLAAPIPRSLWPEKPMISRGAWIKEELFGLSARYGGWPPGFVAEAYMNFSYLGILIVPLLLGLITRIYFNSFQAVMARSPVAFLLYLATLWQVALLPVTDSVAKSLSGILMSLAVVVPVLLLTTRRAPTPSSAISAHRI